MSSYREETPSDKLQRFQHGEGGLAFEPDEFKRFSGVIATSADLHRKLIAVDTLLKACAGIDEYAGRALASFDHLMGGKIGTPGVYYPTHGGIYTCKVILPPSEHVPKVSQTDHVWLLALNGDTERAIVHGNTGYDTPHRQFATIIDTTLREQAADVYYYDHTERFQCGPESHYIGVLLVEQLKTRETPTA